MSVSGVRYGSSGRSLSSFTSSRSVYAGAGGKNVKISYPSNNFGSGFDVSGALAGAGGSGDTFISGSKKMAMQNLNDRLAAYLEKVRSLEAANARLECQIREWNEKQTPSVRDYSKYEAIITDLRNKIRVAAQDNARLMLQIDNARLAAEDFRIKFENELAARMSVEMDIAGLRKVLDDLTVARSDLEMQVEGLKEELVYLKKNHAEEMAAVRAQMTTGCVNVEVDAKPQEDMNTTLSAIRAQYEGITDKNRCDIEAWYKIKFDSLNKEMATSTETLQTSHSEITDLKRTLQALQIELQSQLSLKAASEAQLRETESCYSQQLSCLQCNVNDLENELCQMRADIERQATEYQLLLDIKTRLEMEIAEYRRLLDGEDVQRCVVIKEVKEVKEERKPVKTQRTRVVIEEIIDGKVVSSTVDMDEKVLSG